MMLAEEFSSNSINTIAICSLIGFVVFLIFAYNIIDTIVTNRRLSHKRKCNGCPTDGSPKSASKGDFFAPFTEARKSNFTVTSTASGPDDTVGPMIKIYSGDTELNREESAKIAAEMSSAFKDFREFMYSVFNGKSNFDWNNFRGKFNTRLSSINNKIREAADKQKAADNPPKTNTEPPKEKNDAV